MKKFYFLLLLGLLAAGNAVAQTTTPPADPPGLLVSKISWQKDVFIPALYDDPMRPNQEQVNLKREQKVIAKANNVRVQGGQNPLPMPTREIMSANRPAPPGPSINYVYKAKVTNTGSKTIQAMIWEYGVLDDNGVEVGVHRFLDNTTIRAGKTANLVGVSTTPAVAIVTVKSPKDLHSQYSERVIIHWIQYEDGSYWQRPGLEQ
ncbi:MAG TPA: hypothetical protein VIW64_12570 [Pyrinomonadaceae bacterium]